LLLLQEHILVNLLKITINNILKEPDVEFAKENQCLYGI
jgi:hypothetical protein